MTHQRGLSAILLLGALTLAGCASTTAGTPTVQEAQEQAASRLPGADAGPPIDGCALLSAAEVSDLIGANDGGRPSGISTAGGGCMWENQTTYHSVTVEVGNPGSAPGGVLPKWDPMLGEERKVGTDMRDINGGIEFAAGDRDCMVQVSTTDAAADRASGLALVEKVRQRVG
ncbi:DUF3558 family protein [Pseudonocardia oroxyli]|uniref:DUF3558 domain-containing protein n=1 Tax=Pseudonocardia oroxyli TaxID=366584 RepID=A0A1G7X3A5_PSEOR|nr:DUF3558 family protein [Pseudonocardia oroxyli]SDG78664.1 Protein of unknown function [Pseudonocardia oroxyli]